MVDYSTSIPWESAYKISNSLVGVELSMQFRDGYEKERRQILCKSREKVRRGPWK
jgi:hypothetical protein